MDRLIDRIIVGMQAGEKEGFLAAGEVARAYTLGVDVDTPLIEPYASLLAAEPFTPDDAARLKSSLLEYLKSGPPHGARAVWPLGKFHDKELVPFLRKYLVAHLRYCLDQNGALFQVLCTLDDCGEKVLPAGSHSVTQTDQNISHARQYLSKFGHVLGW